MPQPIICLGVNRLSHGSVTTFFDELDDLITILNLNGRKLNVTGDFNIDLLKSCSESAKFIDLSLSHALCPTKFRPTRPQSETLLDNCFISWPGFVFGFVISYDISDHLPVLIVTNLSEKQAIKINNSTPHLKRNYSKAAINRLQNLLLQETWGDVYSSHNRSCL